MQSGIVVWLRCWSEAEFGVVVVALKNLALLYIFQSRLGMVISGMPLSRILGIFGKLILSKILQAEEESLKWNITKKLHQSDTYDTAKVKKKS